MLNLYPIDNSLPENTYLDYCFKAMKELHNSLDWICFHKEDMDEDDIQVYERNFIISLASILSQMKGFKLPGKINGEVAKSIDALAPQEVKEQYLELKRKQTPGYNPKSCYIFPDFLIHENHSPEKETWTCENQHIIIEAKTSCNININSFFLDFFKLNLYLSYLHFENAIYLIVRTPISKIEEYLLEYEKQNKYLCEDKLDNLYFFVQEQIDVEPKIYRITNKLIRNNCYH